MSATESKDIASDAIDVLAELIRRVRWNGHRQGWDIQPDLPAGTIKRACDLLARARGEQP